jgi:hypothetical protein
MNVRMPERGVALVLLVLAAGCASAPPRRPPAAPRPAPTYTAVVRVYEGPDSAADNKIPGARVTLGGRELVADASGNVAFEALAGGRYEACAGADGWKRVCASGDLPGAAIDLVLERDVPPILPLRIDGRFLVAGDSPTFRGLFQSGLALLARPPTDRDQFLDQTRALGLNGIRVFAGALAWANQTAPGAAAALPELLDAAAARGLRVQVAAITDSGTGYDVGAHLRAIAAIVAAHPNALLEVANEPWHPTQSDEVNDPARLLALARSRVPAGVIYALGAGAEDEADAGGHYATDGGAFNTAHLDRGRDTWNQVRRLREIAGISEATRKPAMSGEPIGAAEPSELVDPVSKKPRQRRTDPEFFFAMGALCRGFELGCVFHSQDGLEAKPLGPVTTACAQAFLAGWRAIDTTDRLQFLNAGWPGSPVAKANFESGVTRAYSFVAASRRCRTAPSRQGCPPSASPTATRRSAR